ncbi:MAG TPA: DUF3243 domain-containing protein [Bacillota bacterium]|nr:DUF3243 domain-containing protein [Bacillota bacterium]
MSVLDDFDTWKSFLSDRIDEAEASGMSDKTISMLAQEVGGYLSEHVDSTNKEVEVLKDLWNVASKKEQQALANTMVKLVQNEG